MNLGWSAVTLAGHGSLIISIVLVLWNAILARRSFQPDMPISKLAPMLEPVIFFCTMLGLERAYYVAARALVNRGVNLWEAHPSPEVLAVGLAAMTFWVAARARSIGALDLAQTHRAVRWQAVMVVSVFCGLSWGLW